jgi:hypothetical protein
MSVSIASNCSSGGDQSSLADALTRGPCIQGGIGFHGIIDISTSGVSRERLVLWSDEILDLATMSPDFRDTSIKRGRLMSCSAAQMCPYQITYERSRLLEVGDCCCNATLCSSSFTYLMIAQLTATLARYGFRTHMTGYNLRFPLSGMIHCKFRFEQNRHGRSPEHLIFRSLHVVHLSDVESATRCVNGYGHARARTLWEFWPLRRLLKIV